MTRFRALLVGGVVALTFGFGGCFDWGGDPCNVQASAAGSAGGSDGDPCEP